MKTTISVLSVNEMKIIKQVNLVIQNRNKIDITAGIILYEREFSETYTFEEKKKDEKDFFHFSTYPKQEDYPNDHLDSLILETIKTDFPKAQFKSNLLFSSSDVEHYDNLTKRPFEKAELNCIPDFSGIDLSRLPTTTFKGFRKEINIYVDGSSEVIKNRIFKGYCDFRNHEQIYDRLDAIKFL
ncbi:hypothetical protein [Cellulophaga sp. L1A9]|uniref:hypothetical protein n=1 Tax=Cellulophaga sp. L1A9 TaxID=2686362 RepID=UPI00131C9992|nr:hypothetical protein [Cellulophaga sp. L1A9]